ncbi:MAG TPA: hypothetical protein VFV84_11340 [Burkholderiales bacterium]|nr:hypothetical protein [Burkholderiales bacterium]
MNPIPFLFLAGLAFAAPAWAADIYLITHPGLTLTPAQAKEVFLGEKQFAGDQRVVPLDNASAQSEFVRKTFGIDVDKYRTIWTKKSFRDGLNPPAVKADDEAVLATVRSTPGAIGYVTSKPSGVTVLQKY